MPEHVLSGRRVMVVEDEYFLADELNQTLTDAGVRVLGPVPSVQAALNLLKADDAPDAAVLDVNLGGTMAFPVADALQARSVPFLFSTGYDQAALPERHADVRRLEKPLEAAVLLRELGRLLAAT